MVVVCCLLDLGLVVCCLLCGSFGVVFGLLVCLGFCFDGRIGTACGCICVWRGFGCLLIGCGGLFGFVDWRLPWLTTEGCGG